MSKHLVQLCCALGAAAVIVGCDPGTFANAPTVIEEARGALTEDTTWVRCPKNSGFRKCRLAFPDEVMYVDRIILNDFVDVEACQDAGAALRPVVNNGGLIISEDPDHTNNTGWIEWDEDGELPWEGVTLTLPNYSLQEVHKDNLRHNLYHEGGHLYNYEHVATPEKVSTEEFAQTCTAAEGTPTTSGGMNEDDGDGGYCYVIDYWYSDTGEHIRRDVLACFPSK